MVFRFWKHLKLEDESNLFFWDMAGRPFVWSSWTTAFLVAMWFLTCSDKSIDSNRVPSINIQPEATNPFPTPPRTTWFVHEVFFSRLLPTQQRGSPQGTRWNAEVKKVPTSIWRPASPGWSTQSSSPSEWAVATRSLFGQKDRAWIFHVFFYCFLAFLGMSMLKKRGLFLFKRTCPSVIAGKHVEEIDRWVFAHVNETPPLWYANHKHETRRTPWTSDSKVTDKEQQGCPISQKNWQVNTHQPSNYQLGPRAISGRGLFLIFCIFCSFLIRYSNVFYVIARNQLNVRYSMGD